MSSRQTGSRYMNNGGSRKGYEGGVAGGIQKPGLIPSILGQGKMSGGLTTGADGKLSYAPYQGSSGLFGGQSRINAALLNQQLGSQVLGQQHEKELSAQENQQQQAMANLQSTLTEHLNKSQQINAIASKLGIPVDQLTASLGQELASNAMQDTKNTGVALKDPNVQKSYSTGLIAGNEAQGAKNAALRAQVVPSGGIGIMPGMTSGQQPSIGYGATPRQSTVPNVMNFNGNPVTVGTKTIQDYSPAQAKIPVSSDIKSQMPSDEQNGTAANIDGQQQPQLNALQQYLNGGMTAGSAASAAPGLNGFSNNPAPDNILTSGAADPSQTVAPQSTDNQQQGSPTMNMMGIDQNSLSQFYQMLMSKLAAGQY